MSKDRIIQDGPAVTLTIAGIKCDAAGCGYYNESVPGPGESYEDYLDRPCPSCGASLLTKEDLKLMQTINAGAELMNALANGLGVERGESLGLIGLEMHGDGSLTIRPKT